MSTYTNRVIDASMDSKSTAAVSSRGGRGYADLVGSLASVVDHGGQMLPEHVPGLRQVVDRLRSPRATLTFGGRFKAGKSSLLNAAIGRRLLPTQDLPLTGANCHIMAGDRDRASVVNGHEVVEIPCTTESLHAAISLRGGPGRLDHLSRVNRVEIRLADFPGGPDCRWIDPPGMFDRPEMTERAWQSAHEADVLVWILRSQQFLGEKEVEAIAQFIAERGPASVVFVENAFLPRDEPDPWAYHREQITPYNRDKLLHLARELGLPPQAAPSLTVVSAEQALDHRGQFGGKALAALLSRLAGPDSSQVRLARLQWAEMELRRVAEAARAAHDDVADTNRARKREIAAREREVASRRERFAKFVSDAVGATLNSFESAAATCGETVASEIATGDLKRDSTYSHSLNSKLTGQAFSLADSLADQVSREVKRLGWGTLSTKKKDELRKVMDPPWVTVKVENNDVSGGGILGGAAAGAAVGSVVPVIGTLLGAAAGAIFGAAAAGKSSLNKDIADTKANARNAAAEAAQALRNRSAGEQALNLILGACAPAAQSEELPRTDCDREARWAWLVEGLDDALRRASDLIRAEMSR